MTVTLGDISQERFTSDPRDDLVHDSFVWTLLLRNAWAATGGLEPFGILHGLRCCGAGLRNDGTGWRIVAGEMDPDEYEVDRARWLMPVRREVAELLKRLAVL